MSEIVSPEQKNQDSIENRVAHSEAVEQKEEPLQDRPSITVQMDAIWEEMISTPDITRFCVLAKEFCVSMIGSQDEEVFFSYFIERKFLKVLHEKIIQFKEGSEILRTTFSLLQFLLKALKTQEKLVYFLVKVNQEQFVQQEYSFSEEEDRAYYANFLKLMVRKVNEDSKYTSVFLNSKDPHFPLLLQLLRMHNCTDRIMQTSSKLAILELSSSSSQEVQEYLANFPFVLFYPLICMQTQERLRLTVEDNQNTYELQGGLKYMEQFMENKQRYVIDMYTNSFLRVVGRWIYNEMTHLTEKNISKGVKILKVLLDVVIPELTVVKLKACLLCLFSPLLPSKMRKCFEAKGWDLQKKYWLPEVCSQEIVNHCRAIFFTEKHPTKSFIKTLNSYIPGSKDNWLFHEVKTISQIIGFKIELHEPINTDQYGQGSFLEALWSMIDDDMVRNEVFSCIQVFFKSTQKTKSQQIMFYYLRVLLDLCDCSEAEGLISFDPLMPKLVNCCSLSLLHIFYNLVVKVKNQPSQSELLSGIYQRVTSKLVHFVLTKGWKETLFRIKESRVASNNKTFSADIYREIQCEILLFTALRTLLGTDNQECCPFTPDRWQHYPNRLSETIFKCREGGKNGPLLLAILDGQFLNFRDSQEKLVNKEELLLSNIQFYNDGEKLDIIVGNTNSNFCVTVWVETDIRQYMLRELASRRQMAERVALQLKQLKFQFDLP